MKLYKNYRSKELGFVVYQGCAAYLWREYRHHAVGSLSGARPGRRRPPRHLQRDRQRQVSHTTLELNVKKIIMPTFFFFIKFDRKCHSKLLESLQKYSFRKTMNNISSFVKPNFSCTCRPGGIAELTRIISNVGVSIKDIVHERAWVRKATFSVGVSEYICPRECLGQEGNLLCWGQ